METDDRDQSRRDRDDSFEREDRDERPPRRSSSNRSVWMIVIAAGCGLVLLCGGGLVALVGWGVRGFVKDLPAATAVSDQFFSALQQGKIDDAYALTSAKFRAGQSREEFEQFVKKFETF